MVTQRSIAQAFLALQVALTALLAVILAIAHDQYALVAAAAAVVTAIAGLVLSRRSVDIERARLKAQTEAAEAARERAEAAAREATAARDRATKLEATLLQQQRLESVGRLAGGVAHDFNNLLTVIGASASMAERAIEAGASPQADLQEVQLAVARASELTKQLLVFARPQGVSAADAVPATSGVLPVARATQRVLVVEDEPQVRAIAARALTNAGFEVLQAANGALGLAVLKEQLVPFDVLVTDVVMPELSGPDLARAARAFDQNLSIVFMSGFPEDMHRSHAGEFASAAFLAKPFAPSALVQTVRDCVTRRGGDVREQA